MRLRGQVEKMLRVGVGIRLGAEDRLGIGGRFRRSAGGGEGGEPGCYHGEDERSGNFGAQGLSSKNKMRLP
jgi:hypothetical protein